MVSPAGLGLGTTDQLLPSHCSTNVFVAEPFSELPTATHIVVVGHFTSVRSLLVAPAGSGLVTIDQLFPSHCSTNVWIAPLAAKSATAKQLVALRHQTALRAAEYGPSPGLGLAMIDQLAPFQRSISVCTESVYFSP